MNRVQKQLTQNLLPESDNWESSRYSRPHSYEPLDCWQEAGSPKDPSKPEAALVATVQNNREQNNVL